MTQSPTEAPLSFPHMVTLTTRLPRRGRGFWFGLAIDLIWPLVVVFLRMRMSGRHHIPRQGGVLLACNHLSFADPITTTSFALAAGRVPRYLAKASLWRLPLVGWVMASGKHIPVDRGTIRAGLALGGAQRSVEAGECVVVYPEGTFTRDPDGWPMRGKSGIAHTALMSRTPVIPVAQWGTQRLLPPGTFLPRLLPRKRIDMVAGAEVDLSDLYGCELTREVLDVATARIMAAVTALLVGIRRTG